MIPAAPAPVRSRAEGAIGSDPVSSAPVGLVGCGHLGLTLGARLLASGRPLIVFDREPRAAEPLLEAGASWAATAAELASMTTFLVSCLPGPREVQAVVREMWASALPRTIHLETSTVGLDCMRTLAGEASRAGIWLLDGPVSRGGVRDGRQTLVLWIGAQADHLDLARPTLERMGDRVVYCGGVGLGQTTKIVNNLIAHTLVVLLAEALAMGVGAGASLDVLSTALQHGTGQTRMLDELFPASVFQGDFRPGLRLDLASKDLDLALELARDLHVELALVEPVRELFERARQRGWGDLSVHTAVRLIEEATGVSLRSLRSDETLDPSDPSA
jgi:3-hydroxyisobutyrate dehydrogenase-like beta-hydroxyacid dehydrogenase